jgi:hypothetical protein
MLVSDFWFDEIYWLERFVRPAESALEIFLGQAFRHDNNHHLQTFTAYLIGRDAPWIVYRLPPLACGVIAVVSAVFIGSRRGRVEGRIAGILTAASLIVVVCSVEARGYGAVLCAAAVGLLALDRFLRAQTGAALFAFAAAVMVGLAAHPAILHFYLGALLWSGYRLRGDLKALARLHAIPVCWTVCWIALVVRGSVVGGGPAWTWHQIADESLAWTFGYPLGTITPWAAMAMLLLVVVWDARQLWIEGSDEGLFWIGAVVGPVVLIAALSPPFLFPRYFLVPLFFSLLIAARCLSRMFARGWAARCLAGLTLAGFLVGSGAALSAAARDRYRNHAHAVGVIASVGHNPVRVTSESLDQWTELPLRFYGAEQHVLHRLQYIPRRSIPRDGAAVDWVVEPAQPCSPPPAATRTLPGGAVFVLRHSFPVCGPSGMAWHLYAPEAQ